MLLLDTQAFLWVVDGNPRLGAKARERIAGSGGTYVSSATVWELTIKSMLGKVEVPVPLHQSIVAQGLLELPVTNEHVERMREFPELVRHDPFDRMLVAQAASAGLTLLTADRVLLALKRRFIVDVQA
jgi:PIN domain nuclease of toxin-antitoxin system